MVSGKIFYHLSLFTFIGGEKILSQKKIIDLGSKKIDLSNDDIPIALNYFGRLEVRDWEELFFVAVKCLFLEFPDVINQLCSKDPTQILYLRTTSIEMKKPRRIAPIIFLETKRTPMQIVQALRKIFLHAGVLNINMTIEVMPPTSKAEIEKIFSGKIEKLQGRNLEKNNCALRITHYALKQVGSKDLDVPHFGRLYFILRGERFGPFANEKSRYVELLKNLAELFPKEMQKCAGRHINSQHRLTLAHGENYLYFREPVMLPNDLFADKGFSDTVLQENEKYFLERCGLKFESVIF